MIDRIINSFALATALAFPLGASHAQEDANPRAGLAYAREQCAGCHAILKGQTRSPLPTAPPFEDIAVVPRITAAALRAMLETPHRTMPSIVIEIDDMRNVVAYILSMKPR